MLSMTLGQVERLLEYRWLVANGIELSPEQEEEFRLLAGRASHGRQESEDGSLAAAAWEASAGSDPDRVGHGF